MARRTARKALGAAAAAFTGTWSNPSLRRAQLSFLAYWGAECAFAVALSILAYNAGGALAVGFVGLLTVLPSAVLTPVLAPLADRRRRERVLMGVSAVRGSAMAAAAVVVALSGPTVIVYVLAAVSAVAATLFRPAHSALLPSLCRTGGELAGANVVRGLLDAAGALIGPLLAALLLAASGIPIVFAVAAASAFCGIVLLVGVRAVEHPERPTTRRRLAGLASDVVDGFRAVGRSGGLQLILLLVAAQTLTRGALTVFSVVTAIRLLDMGESGAGVLMAAVGLGAVVGSLGASVLVGMWRLGAWFAIGMAMWGVPLILIGLFPGQAFALGVIALIGVGNALIDAAGFTLIGRLAPDAVMARVFGLLESLVAVSTGLGSMLASALVVWFGIHPALIGFGLLCPVLAAASWFGLRRIDRSVDALDGEIRLLRQVPMFDPLPLPAIELLARGLETVSVAPGRQVFAQGDVGDRYYVVESGQADVIGDGRVVATVGPGEGFGEIALLRRTPRTATVVARSPLTLRALASQRFTSVVLGYTPSSQAAAADVADRLSRYSPGDLQGDGPSP